MRNLALASAAVMATLVSMPCLAQTRSQVWGGTLTKQAQTIFVRAESGVTTYESETAGSKETQGSSTYQIGGWAGEERIVGISITSTTADVPFSLNGSNLSSSFRDVRMMARWGWFMPSFGVSLSEIDITKSDTEAVGIYATGMNAGFAVGVPLHDSLVLQAEGMTVQNTKAFDKLDEGTTLGRRDEADAHLSFDVTDRIVDLLVGYRLKTYELEVAGQKNEEKSQGAYAGVRVGLYF